MKVCKEVYDAADIFLSSLGSKVHKIPYEISKLAAHNFFSLS